MENYSEMNESDNETMTVGLIRLERIECESWGHQMNNLKVLMIGPLAGHLWQHNDDTEGRYCAQSLFRSPGTKLFLSVELYSGDDL